MGSEPFDLLAALKRLHEHHGESILVRERGVRKPVYLWVSIHKGCYSVVEANGKNSSTITGLIGVLLDVNGAVELALNQIVSTWPSRKPEDIQAALVRITALAQEAEARLPSTQATG